MNTDPEMSKELRGRLKDLHDRLERVEGRSIARLKTLQQTALMILILTIIHGCR